jgi:hypothetical protein
MPNNSNARREKDKKKKDKKKKTDPSPLHKEDKAGADSSTLSSSSAGSSARKASISSSMKSKDVPLSLYPAGTSREEELHMTSEESRRFMIAFAKTLMNDEGVAIFAKTSEANPGLFAKEMLVAHHAALAKAVLEAQERKNRGEKDSSCSLSLSSGCKGGTVSSVHAENKDASLPLLHLGTVKPTAPLSSSAEPKSGAFVEWENSQSLSKEERAIVYAETREGNPGADMKDFALAYKNALLKAGIKK